VILWQANLGRGVSAAEFERNLRRVLDEAGPRAVICLQEIDEADRPDEMATLVELAKPTHRIVGRRTAVPILVPRHLDLQGSIQTPACKGLALFTPNRIVNEARIKLGVGLTVGVLNTHLPIDRLVTRNRRRQVRHALRDRALAYDAGAWVADTNTRKGWPRITPGERPVIEAGIDKAKAWAPGGWRVEVRERWTVPLTIDNHDAHGARLMWVRREGR
jgi:endonuclease/exonuclease/phosphatase family metal-dependent hydrolase